MRRPTTGSTTVYPSLEKLTADDHAIIRRLAHDATDPHAFQTSLIASRALCAIALCGRKEGEGVIGVMVMQMAWPEGYLPDASFERAAKAIGVAEIAEGPRWEVRRFECPKAKAAKEMRRRRIEIAEAMRSLELERNMLHTTCPHVNLTHHPRGTAEDRPWDQCEDCGQTFGE